MAKARIATVWLDGCSGCHMSFLDIDERLIQVAELADLVYSPLVDFKAFPDEVDIALVEGAVASEEDLHKIQKIRQNTRLLVSLGDCAVTGNVPAMRNGVPVAKLLHTVYVDRAQENRAAPTERVPALMKQARPVRDYVKVDLHAPGCPPSAQAIFGMISDLLEGRKPDASQKLRFG